MDTRASTRTRLSVLPVFIALLMNLFIGPLAPIIQQLDANVLAAPVTVPDEDGPNDEPGQKDLTQLTIDYDSAPGVTLVTWNWDETGTSGANTLDACSLFDINDNLFVDFALCAITVGDPAQSSPGCPRAYTCGDDRVDRCTNQVLVSDFDSTCTIGAGVNPFDGGRGRDGILHHPPVGPPGGDCRSGPGQRLHLSLADSTLRSIGLCPHPAHGVPDGDQGGHQRQRRRR